MGKKSKSTSEPSKYAKPYITGAANTAQATYNQNQGNLNSIAETLRSGIGGVAENAFGGNPLLDSANSYVGDVLGGKYLDAGNPYLEQIIGQTGNSVSDRVNSIFSASGRTGSNRHVGELTRELADSENALRYQNYGDERSAMASAAGLVPGLTDAQYAGIAPLLGLAGTAAELPYLGSNFLSGSIGGLLGNSTTTTQKQGLGNSLAGLAGAGLAGWASGGFK